MFLGKHYIVNYYRCDSDILRNVGVVENILRDAARVGDLTIVDSFYKQFEPYGVSGASILKESHITIHTWPEHGFAALDIFVCDDNSNPLSCIQYIRDKLDSDSYEIDLINRGYIENDKKN